jgi:hypothetical protein
LFGASGTGLPVTFDVASEFHPVLRAFPAVVGPTAGTLSAVSELTTTRRQLLSGKN